jgi:RimJ/RimL family protein N-acetyltransferase
MTAPFVQLKPIPAADLPALAQGLVPESLGAHVIPDGLPPPSVARRIQQLLAAGQPAYWVGMCYIFDADGCCIGGCGFKHAPTQREVEVGYGLAETRRGQGYASAALRELLLMAAGTREIDSVIAHISSDNLASARLAKRHGFVAGDTVLEDGEWVVRWRRVLTPEDARR